MEGQIEIKVYYEDTDSLGMVYYANYLKYLERGRTELVDSLGQPIGEWNRQGYNFVVFQVQVKYLKPARLGDTCQVYTAITGGSEWRKKIAHRIERGGEVITEAKVELVCLDDSLQLREFPGGLFD